jgi:heme o synthase
VVARIADYVELSKPGITLFIAMSTATGYILAPGPVNHPLFWHTVIATALAAAGAAALNEYFERDVDAAMTRTSPRPLPSARVRPSAAAVFGILLGIIGVVDLFINVRPTTAIIAALAFVTYVFVYTPLKKITPLCTLVGTLPGALPILAGWSAQGSLRDGGGWALFAILVFWQLPHFYSLAWLYREDYQRAGLRMLTVTDPDGAKTRHAVEISAVLLTIAAFVPMLMGMSGMLYGVGALALNIILLRLAFKMKGAAMNSDARRLFGFSLVYLPAILALLLVDAVRMLTF